MSTCPVRCEPRSLSSVVVVWPIQLTPCTLEAHKAPPPLWYNSESRLNPCSMVIPCSLQLWDKPPFWLTSLSSLSRKYKRNIFFGPGLEILYQEIQDLYWSAHQAWPKWVTLFYFFLCVHLWLQSNLGPPAPYPGLSHPLWSHKYSQSTKSTDNWTRERISVATGPKESTTSVHGRKGSHTKRSAGLDTRTGTTLNRESQKTSAKMGRKNYRGAAIKIEMEGLGWHSIAKSEHK
jgi:hypothetical protein